MVLHDAISRFTLQLAPMLYQSGTWAALGTAWHSCFDAVGCSTSKVLDLTIPLPSTLLEMTLLGMRAGECIPLTTFCQKQTWSITNPYQSPILTGHVITENRIKCFSLFCSEIALPNKWNTMICLFRKEVVQFRCNG